jgi:cytochrome P450
MAADLPQNQPPEAELQFDAGGTDDSLERMIELFARHGDTYRVYVPSRKAYTYVVHHPDDVKRVLVTHHRNYTKGVGLDRVKILLGKGIMTSEGELWKRQRYMMQPFFHRRVLAQFAQLVSAVNERWLARWEPLANRHEPVNITDEVSDLTLDIVLRSIFGTDLDRMTAEGGGVNPFELVAKDTGRNLKFAFKFRSLTKLVSELIARRRTDGIEHVDFLAMLMSARDKDSGAPMAERELIDELMTLVVAGHETTASALNWTWYLLATHPEAQARLHAEVDAAPAYQAPSLEQMEALSYTGYVVNESLRLYPPGWVLSHRTIEADVLGGYDIPPGSNVLLPLYLLHRHPGFWKDPDLFRPERFAPEHEAERPRFAYMPFAAGPRHCIGETLAVYEMLVHLYKAARRYRVTRFAAPGAPPAGPPELEAQINLRTRHPLYMTLERR